MQINALTPAAVQSFVAENWRGFMVANVIALAARFLSEHYGAPALLLALLLGIAFHFLVEDTSSVCRSGIQLSATTILRLGVMLLGARISFDLILRLGPELIIMVIGGVAGTILFGWLFSWLLTKNGKFGVLTGGAVAICGASAAMAISAVLPRDENSEKNLLFTVLSVTILSTVAMIFYPILTSLLGFSDAISGAFLGATIHDVAQVAGAGFSISDEAGEAATLVKLMRVALLAPVVLLIALVMRNSRGVSPDAKRPPILPGFVAGFLVLATVKSFGLVPVVVGDFMSMVSQWALLTSIAAVGVKTSLKRILDVGGYAVGIVVAETIFLGVFVLIGLMLLGY